MKDDKVKFRMTFEPNGIDILLPDGDTMMRITVREFYNDFRTVDAEVIEQKQIKKLEGSSNENSERR